MSEPAANQDQNPIRRMTNQELWDNLLNGMVSDFGINQLEKELERRLRKIGFLPALRHKEDA